MIINVFRKEYIQARRIVFQNILDFPFVQRLVVSLKVLNQGKKKIGITKFEVS